MILVFVGDCQGVPDMAPFHQIEWGILLLDVLRGGGYCSSDLIVDPGSPLYGMGMSNKG